MEPDGRFWVGKRVCVTGGTGFLGWHLVRQAARLARHVRVFGLRPASLPLREQLHGFDCVFGDVRDPTAVRHAVRDCDVVFHTAGTVATWGPALREMHEIHREGTRQVIEALPAAARMVHTSSVVAVGASLDKEVLNETSAFNLKALKVDYVHAKKSAEDVALEGAARGLYIVVVNPAYLIGPEDYDLSIMGSLSLRVWKGKVPWIPAGGFNFVDVRDVARGHLLAAERGERGTRYILANEDLTLVEFVNRLESLQKRSGHRHRGMSHRLHAAVALLAEIRAFFDGRKPYPSLQDARVNRYHWYFSPARARQMLGFQTRPVVESLGDVHEWFCTNGFLRRKDRDAPLGKSVKDRRAA